MNKVFTFHNTRVSTIHYKKVLSKTLLHTAVSHTVWLSASVTIIKPNLHFEITASPVIGFHVNNAEGTALATIVFYSMLLLPYELKSKRI